MVLAKKVEELSLNPDFPADAKGIPKFWLHVLKNGNEEALMGLVEEGAGEHCPGLDVDCVTHRSSSCKGETKQKMGRLSTGC